MECKISIIFQKKVEYFYVWQISQFSDDFLQDINRRLESFLFNFGTRPELYFKGPESTRLKQRKKVKYEAPVLFKVIQWVSGYSRWGFNSQPYPRLLTFEKSLGEQNKRTILKFHITWLLLKSCEFDRMQNNNSRHVDWKIQWLSDDHWMVVKEQYVQYAVNSNILLEVNIEKIAQDRQYFSLRSQKKSSSCHRTSSRILHELLRIYISLIGMQRTASNDFFSPSFCLISELSIYTLTHSTATKK